MATGKIGLLIWLVAVTLLWALYPLFFSPARGVFIFAMLTGVVALLGWLSGLQVLVFWSGILGLLNITLALLLSSSPPSLWVGLSAGLTLLALLDGSQRFAYLRHCQVEPGVVTALLDTFVRLSGLSVAAGLVLGCLLITLIPVLAGVATAGFLTVVGACVFVGLLAVFLLYASRTSGN
jgi:hypothetical protein